MVPEVKGYEMVYVDRYVARKENMYEQKAEQLREVDGAHV